MHYYQRLRDLREDKDLTQKQIALLLDTTSQQYSLWERGDREIPFHHVIALANFYKVSLDYIAGRTNIKAINKQKGEMTSKTNNRTY